MMAMLRSLGVADFSTRDEMLKAHELYEIMKENNRVDAEVDRMLEEIKHKGENHQDYLERNGAKV